ncbi:RNA polymerase sigma-70 factor [Dyadobacter beijingensis]|uniref:RNA polymerase sigma-70 factor n=1 Tax=Dyadobacter beijingensis TaxID=365489 RepID=A0ABQ2HRB5_9BACT|nr:sigma-70 family RNA polymerase sigma factor [Dyadobacter beijingensis]GGM89353.1 RNA polymerase sigma-70 factor [Dyadobacter beijingensis]
MPLKVTYNEPELLDQVAQGDSQAFSRLFHAYHQELADYVLRITKSLPMTEEIVQDVFIKIWTRREQLGGVNNFRAYLFISSRNHTFNIMREEARKALLYQQWAADIPFSEDPEHAPDRERYYLIIEDAVSLLAPQQQKVWRMSREEGLKHEEIAQRMQLSRETVKRHVSLALAAISKYVKCHARNVMGILLGLTQVLPN